MKLTKTKYIHNTALMFILIAPFTIGFYAIYVFNPAHAGNIPLYIIQVLADIIAIISVGTLWLTILLDLLQPEHHKKELGYAKDWVEKNNPTVDILIPVRNEPYEVVEKTVRHVLDMDHPHKVYMLDDGPSEKMRELAAHFNLHYIARPAHAKTYAKSGNLNYGLKQCTGEFFAVFDADHAPKKMFLTELLPFFENEHVAVVQTPQHYINTENFIASGTAQAQEIFYKFIQPAKNSYNSAFCVGTNVMFRRSAIDDVGGIPLKDHSEDIWTTIVLHQKGYTSIFYNKILAEGYAPETISAFFRQQNRWARGGFSMFFTQNPLFADKLTIDQRLQYAFSNMHYFTAFTILAYLVLPLIYLLFNAHPMNINENEGWLLHYIPYFLTIYFIPFFLLGSLKASTMSTSLASFAPYLSAFFSVVLKNKHTWVATGAKKKNDIIAMQLWPHVFIITLSFLSILVGWYNPSNAATTAVTSFWVFINAYFLSIFIINGRAST